ncbi:MAG: tetratricopeptide repeat protein, partial [Planctomycetota bacterium]
MELSDEEIDIAVASLLLAKEYSESVDVEAALKEIDGIALQIQAALPENAGVEKVLQKMNETVFSRFSLTSTKPASTMDCFLLNSVLDNDEGNTMGITILYLAIGRRLGLPLFMVRMDDMRIFPRYFDGKRVIDIDVPDEAKSDNPAYRIIETRVEYPVVAWRPGIAELLVLRGSVQWHASKLDSAEADWLRATKIDPENINAWRYLGGIAHQKGDFIQAISYMNNILEIDPKNAMAFYSRGIEWENHGKKDKALADYSRALELDPHNWQVLYSRANIWYQKENYDKVIDDCSKAIENDPDNAGAFLFRGLAWHNKKDYDKALIDYTKTIEISPEWAAAYSYRGMTWNEKWEYRRAADDFDRAIDLEPGNLDFLLKRADTWFLLSEIDKAVADYTQALKHGQNEARILNQRAAAWIRGGNYDKAVEDYNLAIEIEPESIEYISSRAGAYFGEGEYDKAILDYTRILRLAPEDAAIFYNRGVCRFEKKEFELAIHDFSRSIEIDPRIVNPYLLRGRSWHEMGEYDKAIEDYTKVIGIKDGTDVYVESSQYTQYDYMEAEFRRGFAWAKKGNVEKGKEDLSWALSISPENDLAEEALKVRQELLFGRNPGEKLDKAVAAFRKIQLNEMSESEKRQKSDEIAGAWEVITSEGEKGLKRVKKELTLLEEQNGDDDFFQLAAAALLWEQSGFEEADEIARIYGTVDLSLHFNYVFYPIYQAALDQDPRALPMMKALLRENREGITMDMHAMTMNWPYTIELVWGAYGPEGLKPLHELLETSGDSVVLQSAIHLLSKAQHMEALSEIRKHALSTDMDLRRKAIESIGIFGHPEDFDFLLSGLKSEDPDELDSYLKALRSYADLRAVPVLIPLLKSKRSFQKIQLFACLYELLTPESLDAVHDYSKVAVTLEEEMMCNNIINKIMELTELTWDEYTRLSQEEKQAVTDGLLNKRRDPFGHPSKNRKPSREIFLNVLRAWKEGCRLSDPVDHVLYGEVKTRLKNEETVEGWQNLSEEQFLSVAR